MTHAPWTPEQAEILNRFQSESGMHPFTCGNEEHSASPTLIAETCGWRCPDRSCGYTQDWAHAFMLRPDVWPGAFSARIHRMRNTTQEGESKG